MTLHMALPEYVVLLLVMECKQQTGKSWSKQAVQNVRDKQKAVMLTAVSISHEALRSTLFMN